VQKRSKKGSRSLGSTAFNLPVFHKTTGSLKTRSAQTVQTPFSVVFAVLRRREMAKSKTTPLFNICFLYQGRQLTQLTVAGTL
jgi:hypothetical protein